MQDFNGKTALVTGSGSGLGRAAAVLFAQRGANVVVSDVNEAGGAETVRLIEAAGGKAAFFRCDVASETEVNGLIHFAVDTFGRLDCAVNNAGIGGALAPTHLYPADNFERVMAVNCTGVFLCLKAELQVMLKAGGGSIVNVSSLSGLVGFPNNLAYATSKHAVVGLTRTAALEYAPKNIRINAVCPAFTVTPMVEGLLEAVGPERGAKMEAAIPMKRFGQPEEIAEAIVWLCSDAASFVTGHALPIDGGMVAG